MKYNKIILPFCLLILFSGCKDPYNPPVLSVNNAYLVAEGNINGNGTTSIRLSRTLKLADAANISVETNARVSVEGADGMVYDLPETEPGLYKASGLSLNPGAKYRLHINTTANKEYASDYTNYKLTPPIDSISWKATNSGVQVYANTHDPQNNSKYYKWDYSETWEIHSPYSTQLKYANNKVEYDFNANTNVCWKYGQSDNIIVGSSAKLQNDVIKESPVLLIPGNDEKISVRYSMLLNQYVIDEKAYTYFGVMKKNTESLGSIFDAQPSELRGNIHNITDPNEMVIGYITAGSETQKRVFIKNDELTNWKYQMNCETTLVPNKPDSFKFFYPNLYLPYAAKAFPSGLGIEAYYSAYPECVDCTLRGSNIKPGYW